MAGGRGGLLFMGEVAGLWLQRQSSAREGKTLSAKLKGLGDSQDRF